MKKIAVVAAIGIALLLAGGWAVWSRLEDRLVVRNGSAITQGHQPLAVLSSPSTCEQNTMRLAIDLWSLPKKVTKNGIIRRNMKPLATRIVIV
jgi:hypothetical protein